MCTSRIREDGSSASAVLASHYLRLPAAVDETLAAGLEAAYWPCVTVVDYLVTMGQIVQVLIANNLDIDRRRGQLWMRQMNITLDRPPESLPCSFTSVTTSVEARPIERMGKRVHHVVTDSSTSNGVHVIAKLAQVEVEL